MDLVAGTASTLILERGVVLFRGVDIIVAEYICDQVDVAGFLIEVCTIGGT